MSLINDALQRAKQQTAQPMPPPGLPLRPIETQAAPKKNSGLLLPITCASALCAAALLGLIAFKSNRDANAVSAKQASAKAEPLAQAPVEKPLVSKAPDATVQPLNDSTRPATATKPSEPVPPTNSIAMAAEAPALRPAPMKLQAILYSTAKPSAIINGKTVYVGNRLGEFRVASITQSSATLVSDSVTNVLSFQE